MLKVQATFCGSDTTSTSARALSISADRVACRCAAGSLISRNTTGPDAEQAVLHNASMGLPSTGTRSRRPSRILSSVSRAVSGVQPGIVAELAPLLRCSRTIAPAVFPPEFDGENLAVDLTRPARCSGRRRTPRPCRPARQRPGGTGEAGQPGQPLLARRQIFVLLPVGARHDEAVRPRRVRRARRRHGRFARGRRLVECLKRASTWLSLGS